MVCREARPTTSCRDGPRIRKRPNPQFLVLGVVLTIQLRNQCDASDDRRRPPPPPPPEARTKRVENWSQRSTQEDPYIGIGWDQPYGGPQKDHPDTSTASWHAEKSRFDHQDYSPYKEQTDPSTDGAAADWYNNDDDATTQPYPYRDRYDYYSYDGDTDQPKSPSHSMARDAATSKSAFGVPKGRPRNIGPQMPIHYEFPINRETAKDQERQEQGDTNDEYTSFPTSASARRDLVTRHWATKTGKAQIMISSTLIGVALGNFLGKVWEREAD
jgi:hypothetical protein